MSFEEAMAALESVVSVLEKGEVALEQSITLYDRGAALKAHCAAKLAARSIKDSTWQPKQNSCRRLKTQKTSQRLMRRTRLP
jgi:exodeoxyribonuclease VII small subunit